MGLGWWLTEELIYDQNTGKLLTDNTWVCVCNMFALFKDWSINGILKLNLQICMSNYKQYKPMMPADIPEDLRVTLLRNAPNPFGVLSSKCKCYSLSATNR